MNVIQSVQGSSQIKEPCSQCGGVAMHLINGTQLCCECYIKAGYIPPDWHPDCMKWKLKLHPPKRWKFTIGDRVTVSRNPYGLGDNAEAFVTGLSNSGYEGYEVIFTQNGSSLAWVEKSALTLITEA